MNTNLGRITIAVMLAALSASTAYANVTRCKNGLASVGDSKAAVLQKCGQPQHKDSFCKPSSASGGTMTKRGRNTVTVVNTNTCETVDEWTYVPESGQFMTALRFETGKLVSITSGDRVP